MTRCGLLAQLQERAFFVAIFGEPASKLEFDVSIRDEVGQNYSTPGQVGKIQNPSYFQSIRDKPKNRHIYC